MASATDAKLAYLKETKEKIKTALRRKGQTVSNADTFRSYADKILAIEGGGATETDIIPEQEFTLALNSQLGVYMASGFDLFSLKSGEEYYVVWGEETFTCTAVDGVFEGAPCVAIGNPYPVGGTNNNLPFVIGCVPNLEGHTLCLIVALAEQTETKKVRVYQKVGDGDTPFGKYVEIFPEQTITPTFDDYQNQYSAELNPKNDDLERNPNKSGIYYYYEGMLFFVWFDGVLYPCGTTIVPCESSTSPIKSITCFGNSNLVKKLYSHTLTVNGNDSFSEPFCFLINSQGFLVSLFTDGKPHTLKIGCIQRNITKIES